MMAAFVLYWVTNRWTTFLHPAPTDWYAVDLASPHDISTVKLYLMADGLSTPTQCFYY